MAGCLGTDPCTVQLFGVTLRFVDGRRPAAAVAVLQRVVRECPELHVPRCLLVMRQGTTAVRTLPAITVPTLTQQRVRRHHWATRATVYRTEHGWVRVHNGDPEYVLVTREGFELLVCWRGSPPTEGLLHPPDVRNLLRDAERLGRLLTTPPFAPVVVDPAHLDAVHTSDDPDVVLALSLNLLYCLTQVPLTLLDTYRDVFDHGRKLAEISRKYPQSVSTGDHRARTCSGPRRRPYGNRLPLPPPSSSLTIGRTLLHVCGQYRSQQFCCYVHGGGVWTIDACVCVVARQHPFRST